MVKRMAVMRALLDIVETRVLLCPCVAAHATKNYFMHGLRAWVQSYPAIRGKPMMHSIGSFLQC